MKTVLILLFSLIYSDLLACSCSSLIPRINKRAITNAKDIFIGKVIKIEQNDSHSKRIVFQIVEALKTDSATTISVFTGLGGGDCGLTVEEGQEWYIFSYEENAQAWAGICGRSALLSEPSISPNPYSNKHEKQAIRYYNKSKIRAKREINFVRKNQV